MFKGILRKAISIVSALATANYSARSQPEEFIEPPRSITTYDPFAFLNKSQPAISLPQYQELQDRNSQLTKDVESFVKFRYQERINELRKQGKLENLSMSQKKDVINSTIWNMGKDKLEVRIQGNLYKISEEVIRDVVYKAVHYKH